MHTSALVRYYQLVEQELGADVARGLRFRLEKYLFPGISLEGKRFLDIGGGTGTPFVVCSVLWRARGDMLRA
jgi:hypothetical protein